MQVHHCKNEDQISILGVNYAIWKASDLAPTYVVFKKRPSVWKTYDRLYSGANFGGKIVAETSCTVFIIIYGVEKFRLSLGMKTIFHLAVNRSMTLSNTTSPGTNSTLPDRSSSRRLFAVSVHFASMSALGIFKLRNSESAMSARSSTGRDRASSIILFVVIATSSFVAALVFHYSTHINNILTSRKNFARGFCKQGICFSIVPLALPEATGSEQQPVLVLNGDHGKHLQSAPVNTAVSSQDSRPRFLMSIRDR